MSRIVTGLSWWALVRFERLSLRMFPCSFSWRRNMSCLCRIPNGG